jgi:hypothetical protein
MLQQYFRFTKAGVAESNKEWKGNRFESRTLHNTDWRQWQIN